MGYWFPFRLWVKSLGLAVYLVTHPPSSYLVVLLLTLSHNVLFISLYPRCDRPSRLAVYRFRSLLRCIRISILAIFYTSPPHVLSTHKLFTSLGGVYYSRPTGGPVKYVVYGILLHMAQDPGRKLHALFV